MCRRCGRATVVGPGSRVSTHTRPTQKGTTTMTTSIRTPFGFSSTADDVIEGVDLSGRRVIVTGGSSGIGVETARALASAGAEVTLAVRRTAAGDQVAAELVRSTGNEAIFVQPLELSDQRSVRPTPSGCGTPRRTYSPEPAECLGLDQSVPDQHRRVPAVLSHLRG